MCGCSKVSVEADITDTNREGFNAIVKMKSTLMELYIYFNLK